MKRFAGSSAIILEAIRRVLAGSDSVEIDIVIEEKGPGEESSFDLNRGPAQVGFYASMPVFRAS